MNELKTAEDVVQKLIEKTQRGELPWQEVNAVGELVGYRVEREHIVLMLERPSGGTTGLDGTSALLVDRTLILRGTRSLSTLEDMVYQFLCRRKTKDQEFARERAISQAAQALQELDGEGDA